MEAFNRISPAGAGIRARDGRPARRRHGFLLGRWPRFLAILLFYAVMAAVGLAHSQSATSGRTPVAAASY